MTTSHASHPGHFVHLVATLLLSLVLAPSANAAVPAVVQVEGLLTSTGGGPAADGDYDGTFRLYTQAQDGAAAWSEVQKLAVKGGLFTAQLGGTSPLAGVPSDAGLWLSVQVGSDPELPRQRLAAAFYALRTQVADALQCSACVTEAMLDPKWLATVAKKGDLATVASTGNYSDLKGTPDLSAFAQTASLATVAVSGAYADLDGTPDLTAYAKTAALAKVAGTGAYADLQGLPVLAKVNTACGTGLVVRALKADGSLDCVAAIDLPKDGLDEISNDLLTTQFTETTASSNTPVNIPDNNPVGVSDNLTIADFGVAQGVTVSVDLANSDISKLKVVLYDPANSAYVLHDKSGSGSVLKTTWPTLTKTVSGDLASWVGKNPKGKWSLSVIDTAFLNNATDGKVNAWSVSVQVLSDKKVAVTGALQFLVATSHPIPCTVSNTGAAYVNSVDKALYICNGKDFAPLALQPPLGSEANPGKSCQAIKTAAPTAASGVYWVQPKTKAFQAYCDLSTAGKGWTMLLNLDTSDGHVMWWANDLWTNNLTKGDVTQALKADFKSDAYMDLDTGAEILVVVHEQGSYKGWKRFKRNSTVPLVTSMAGGDNVLIGSEVLGADLTGLWAGEGLARLSTKLYANHCVNEGSACTSTSSAGSSDGDRIGSNEGTPTGNTGGGLGNWHDMAYCCAGKSYVSKTCNGSAFRTTSEAQAGWGYVGQNGTFGTDTFGTATTTQNDTNCGNANWAKLNGVAYDYAIFFGGE
jgi:subtilisin-like proprotein convertase family protein